MNGIVVGGASVLHIETKNRTDVVPCMWITSIVWLRTGIFHYYNGRCSYVQAWSATTMDGV